MSLGIVIKGTEGLVIAADSRVTLFPQFPGSLPGQQVVVPSTFDNATKLLRINSQKYVAAVTYGVGAIGGVMPRTASSFMPEIEAELPNETRVSVEDFAKRLSGFFLRQWGSLKMPPNPPFGEQMFFLVAGYDEGSPYGSVFGFSIPSLPSPKSLQPAGQFGANWGGQIEFTDRLMQGFDPKLPQLAQELLGVPREKIDSALGEKLKVKLGMPIPWQFLPLQDCVDLAILLVKTTINLQKFVVGIRGVGGAVDVATITRVDGFKPIQVKEIAGERSF